MNAARPFPLLLAALLALGACSSNVPLKNNVPIESRSGEAPKAPNTVDPRSVARVEPSTPDPLNDPKGILARRSVYFDYDSFEVKDDFRSLVEAHSRYLLANKGRKVLIQGNTDERGGREYNLALGQKRADAVRKMMAVVGVPENQVETVSLGKEKPKAIGSDEASYAENRRADLVYQ